MRIRHWQKYLLLFFAILCSLPSILNHVNYNNLENLLVQKQWLKADRETTELMLKISERKMHGYIDDNSFKRIHCQDLNRINSFWLKYSRNHFGFTIQKEILDDLMTYYHGDFDTVFEKFADRVGWIVRNDTYQYPDLKFNLDAPKGELPSFDWMMNTTLTGYPWNWQGKYLFDRITECRIK